MTSVFVAATVSEVQKRFNNNQTMKPATKVAAVTLLFGAASIQAYKWYPATGMSPPHHVDKPCPRHRQDSCLLRGEIAKPPMRKSDK